MDVTPRLTVTQEQASVITSPAVHESETTTCVLRLGHRPTMPCSREHLQHGKIWSEAGVTPIPEGTRVQVGSWEHGEDTMGFWMKWHPVATATLTEVHAALADGQPYRWYVTLSDIKPVKADQ